MNTRPIASRLRKRRVLLGAALLACLLMALTAQPASAVVPAIPNAGFENWGGTGPSDWFVQAGGTAQASAAAHSGTFAFSFNDPNTTPLTVRWLAPGTSLTEGQAAEQNRYYRLAAWAQSDRGAAGPTMRLWFTNDVGTQIGDEVLARGDQFGVTSSTWKQMQIVAQAPSGATKIVVQLGMRGGTGGGIRFDDVQLDEVNTAAGKTNVYSGWTVERSPDLGSGFGAYVPGGGSVSFTAPGVAGYELNGAAWVSKNFTRPVDSMTFTITTSALWNPVQLRPVLWSSPTGSGVPVVLGIYSLAGGTTQDVALKDLNTRRLIFSGEVLPGQRGPSGPLMDATFSKIRALGPVWRFRNVRSGFYLWTADPAERDYIKKNLIATWFYEGPAYQVNLASQSNQSPLWRFRNLQGGNYLYTADSAEKNYIVANLAKTWKLEGEAYRVSTRNTDAPVWRFRHTSTGIYLYTADPAEVASILGTPLNPWKLEGKAYYLATY